MWFERFFRRPAPWALLFAALLVYGVYALWHTPVEVLPRFDSPRITVIVHDPGASAQEMETLVVRPLEGQLMGLGDLAGLRSTMGEGTAQLTARFVSGSRPQLDLQAVYSAIDRARSSLPPGVVPYAEIMGNAINEVADYSVSIPAAVAPAEVQRTIRTQVLPALRALPGVQRVELFGTAQQALWIQPRPAAMRAHGVGVAALAKAIRRQVVLGPAGHLSIGHQSVSIEARHLPLTVAALERISISTPQGDVPLGAVARVVRAAPPAHYAVELDGRPSLGLIVFKQPGASTVPVDRAVALTLAALQGQLPAGVEGVPIYRQAHLVSLIGTDFGRNLLVGGLLAIAVLAWILGLHRGVFVLALSIPTALLLAIAGLHLFGQSLNLLTLGALTVAVGLLADDGIIVLEAIYHRWEAGQAGMQGVRAGLRDIVGADVTGTLTTVAAYLPLLAVGGLASLFSVPFALAMSLALLASLAVSLTLVPAVLTRVRATGRPGRSGTGFLNTLAGYNDRLLGFTLRRPGPSLGLAVLLFVVGVIGMVLVPVNFLPLPNEGVLLDGFTLPPGTSLAQTVSAVDRMTTAMRHDPAVARTFARIGSAPDTAYTERSFAGEIQVDLKPDVSLRHLDGIARRLLQKAALPGVQQSIDTPTIERVGESFSGLPQPFEITIFGNHLQTLRRISESVTQRLKRVPNLTDVFNNDAYPVSQLRIEPRDVALRAHGLTPRGLYRQVRLLLRGRVLARVPDGDYHLDLYLQLADAQDVGLHGLEQLPIQTRHGWVPLDVLAGVKLVQVPNQLRHLNGARAVEILATPLGPLGSTIHQARAALTGLKLPSGYRIEFGGLYPQLLQMAQAIGLAALGALVLSLAIMALQFGGLRLPVILLLQAPLAVTGGALALAVSGVGLNATGLVGFLTLIGISLNHGIVLFTYARTNEREGMMPEEAVRRAVRTRFRPIVLTTLTAAAGMLPTALGWGVGAAPEQGLAVVVLGGVLWSAVLSTNLLPAVYVRWGRT